jgi:hypothetical protein
MRCAVELDNEAGIATKKIDGEWIDRILPSELLVLEPPSAEPRPKSRFGGRLTAAQTAGRIPASLIGNRHGSTYRLATYPKRALTRPSATLSHCFATGEGECWGRLTGALAEAREIDQRLADVHDQPARIVAHVVGLVEHEGDDEGASGLEAHAGAMQPVADLICDGAHPGLGQAGELRAVLQRPRHRRDPEPGNVGNRPERWLASARRFVGLVPLFICQARRFAQSLGKNIS